MRLSDRPRPCRRFCAIDEERAGTKGHSACSQILAEVSQRDSGSRGPVYVLRMSSETYHEPLELLSEDTKDTHRAIVSLMEELEAIDWYQQRAEASKDPELSAILTHNKNEEVEHAMMTLEWLRRKHEVFAENIETYIGSTGPITEVEEKLMSGASGKGERGASAHGSSGGSSYNNSESLGIGSLKISNSSKGKK